MEKIYLVDALNLLFRGYYAIPGTLTDHKGQQTNALYGFIRSIGKVIKDFGPDHLVIVFDGPENKLFRKKLYPEYKAHRKVMPDEFYKQIEMAHDYCNLAGLPMLCEHGFEADDVIGAVVKWAEKKEANCFIISSDKDLCQLVSDKTLMLNVNKNNEKLDRDGVKNHLGVYPEQVLDLLALMGDSADNIPGLPGIGPKTAATWLEKYKTLDHILTHPEEFKGKKREVIEEHADLALLSRELATIRIDTPIPTDTSFYKMEQPDESKLRAFYEERNFKRLQAELGAAIVEKPQPPKIEHERSYNLINSKDDLKNLVDELIKKEIVAFDCKTSGLHPITNKLIGISFCYKLGKAWYVPLNGNIENKEAIKLLRKLFESDVEFLAHNIKFNLHALHLIDIDVKQVAFDTMVSAYILNPSSGKYSLDHLSQEELGIEKISFESIAGKGAKQKSIAEVEIENVTEYACENVDCIFQLMEINANRFEKENELCDLFKKLELPLIRTLVAMEREGIFVDKKELSKMSSSLTQQIESFEKEIEQLAGEKINLNSPKQVGDLLFDKIGIKGGKRTKTGFSTSADILEKLRHDHPIVEKILSYRMVEKLRSTYVDALPTQIDEKTRRVHCNFMQTVAATGRLSCQTPNLQNIPVRTAEGKKIRATFKPEKPGYSFLAADYSQIELRLLAHMSDDIGLVDAFRQGEDVHIATAAKIFETPIQEVTKEMRFKAKAVNFGVIYGQQAFGLSQGLSIDYKEAKAFINTYFEKYEGVKKFIDATIEKVKLRGYAETLLGRRRPIPDINSKNPMVKKASERLAVNSPLQGSAADLIKIAMLSIEREIRRKSLASRMILQVHDELIFEVPDSEISEMRKLVKDEMEAALELKVPLIVDIKVGKNWGEC